MGVVHLLDDSLANKIAAGEVVERPANAVKELVENSIDAGANQIIVEIKDGGVSYIRVTDNGCGMTKADAQNSFLRHATSKLKTDDDLFNIQTLGFRGEALAAISAVSNVELLTRRPDDKLGTKILISASKMQNIEEAGCPVGTTIVVKNLFFNTPARMKFLKKNATEAANVVYIINRLALSNPSIKFKLINDGKLVLSTDGSGKLKNTIHAIFGKDVSQNLLSVDHEHQFVKVSGFIGKPAVSRSNRNFQVCCINGRVVKSKTFTVAIDQAFKNSIQLGKYPICFLNVSIPFSSIDVNVHPSKMEVKFSNEKVMFEAVYYACKYALENDYHIEKEIINKLYFAPMTSAFSEQIKPAKQTFQTLKNENLFSKIDSKMTFSQPRVESFNAPVRDIYENNKTIEDNQQSLIENKIDYHYIGEIFDTYLIIETNSNFYLIDKHACHERIIFNKLKKAYDSKKPLKQVLITPIVITLDANEYDCAFENIETISNLGFVYEKFGDNKIIVREIPYDISDNDVEGSFIEIISSLLENKNDLMTNRILRVLETVSCRSAIKAGYKNTSIEMQQFIEKLLQMNDVKYCPHGRPIMIKYSKYEIEKRFGRA